MPSDSDFVYVTGDPNKTPVDFLTQPKGAKLTVVSRGREYPFIRNPGPTRVVWRTDDANKTPIDPATISSLPPDTSLTVSNDGREFTTQAGTVFIPPVPTLQVLVKWVRERGGDASSSNKPSNPNSF